VKSINVKESRGQSRRRLERRSDCRRVIKYAFGSEQWVEAVQSSYILWPKLERRESGRRKTERRIERIHYQSRIRRQRVRKQSLHQSMLTAEEKKMLNDLNRR
jgi:hypothetical protein